MQKKTFISVIFFIVTWMFMSAIVFLFINANIQNLKLQKSISILEQRMGYINNSINKAQKLKEKEERLQNGVLDYLQWQFVLRDQVNQANLRLKDEINKTKYSKEDKLMANLLYYNLGLSFTLAVDFGSAIGAFEEALKFNPNDADSCYNLGLLHSTYSQDSNKALIYYKRYLEIYPQGTRRVEVKQRIETLEKK